MKNRKKMVSVLAGVMAFCMLLTLVLTVIPTRANAASSSEIRKQINSLKDEKAEIRTKIEDLKAQYQKNEDEIADMVARKNIIDQEIGLLHSEINNISEQILAFGVLVADKQDELDHAQERYDALNEEYRTRIRSMEEDGTLSYWEVLFKATSFSNLLDRLNMIEEIAASDRRRLEELDKATKEVDTARQELQDEKEELEVTEKELLDTQEELDAKRAEADELIKELLAKADEIEGLREKLEEEDQELLNSIAAKEKEYNEAKHQEWLAYMATYTTVPPETTAPATTSPFENNGGNGGNSEGGGNNNGGFGSTGGGENSGETGNEGNNGNEGDTSGGNNNTQVSVTWLRPCSYVKLTSPFGYRDAPTAGASRFHQGVDLSAPAGTPIYATRAGVVTTATFGAAAGYYVTINHGDGFSSIYMHMTSYAVGAGQAVSAGQLIGYVGMTGTATGNHLHFGIAYNGAYVNPCAYVPM